MKRKGRWEVFLWSLRLLEVFSPVCTAVTVYVAFFSVEYSSSSCPLPELTFAFMLCSDPNSCSLQTSYGLCRQIMKLMVLWGWWSHGTGCPKRLWCLSIFGDISNPAGRGSSALCSSWAFPPHPFSNSRMQKCRVTCKSSFSKGYKVTILFIVVVW